MKQYQKITLAGYLAIVSLMKAVFPQLRDRHYGRMGDPEDDIGGAALLLTSDDASYINGNTLFVDGGSHTVVEVFVFRAWASTSTMCEP